MSTAMCMACIGFDASGPFVTACMQLRTVSQSHLQSVTELFPGVQVLAEASASAEPEPAAAQEEEEEEEPAEPQAPKQKRGGLFGSAGSRSSGDADGDWMASGEEVRIPSCCFPFQDSWVPCWVASRPCWRQLGHSCPAA